VKVVEMSSKGESESEKNQGEEPSAPDTGTQPSNPDGSRNRAQRPLTFQPALDDPDQLKNYLKGVFERHLAERQMQLATTYQPRPAEPSLQRGSVAASQLSASQSIDRPSSGYGTASTSATTESKSKAKMPPAASNAVKGSLKHPDSQGKTKATPRRRTRAGNHASLLRAKNINVYAPDPEEESPPNETDVERRRRKERINGRRKRAKKIIEIDYLNEQYHNLKEENDTLKSENKTLKDRISMVRNLQQTGLLPAGPQTATGNTAMGRLKEDQSTPRPREMHVPSHPQTLIPNRQQPATVNTRMGTDQTSPHPKPPPPTPSVARNLAPFTQHVLPPSSLTFQVNQGVQPNLPQEETKDSFAQPQFVGLERLGPAGFNMPGHSALSTLIGLSQDDFVNQASSLFAHAQPQRPLFSQPSSLALATMRQQQFHSLSSSQHAQLPLLFSMHPSYQQLLASPQPQQQQAVLRAAVAAAAVAAAAARPPGDPPNQEGQNHDYRPPPRL
jgi:hypothetical protein